MICPRCELVGILVRRGTLESSSDGPEIFPGNHFTYVAENKFQLEQ